MMKNFIKISLVLLSTLFITSCTNEDIQNDEINQISLEKTQEKINRQLIFVKEISNTYEEELNNDFFSNIDTKSLYDNNASEKSQEILISNNDLFNSLTKYHNKKLLKIKKLRKVLGFTSIQSIVDEINSLTIINKELADRLFIENSGFLTKGKFGILPKIDSDLALITNKEGNIYNVNNIEKVDVSMMNNIENRVVNPNLSEDILAVNGIYAATWHASYTEKGGITLDINKYKHETRIATYIYFNGSYVAYPSIINIGSNSGFAFFKNNLWLTQDIKVVSFSSGIWVTNTHNVYASTTPYPSLRDGFINANFATVIANNQVLNLTANKVVN